MARTTLSHLRKAWVVREPGVSFFNNPDEHILFSLHPQDFEDEGEERKRKDGMTKEKVVKKHSGYGILTQTNTHPFKIFYQHG